jgi:acyl-coenzyme A thioesterase PaaI-like protein
MLLDEVMAKACLHRGLTAVTVQFEVRFRKPVYVGEDMLFSGRVVEQKGRRILAESRCEGSDGTERATAKALFLRQ